MADSKRSAHALLHLTVLVWGCTALLGRSISIAAIPLVWYRLLLVVPMMAALVVVKRVGFFAPRQLTRAWLGIGVLVAVHWVMFYGCIKEAGVAVAVLCLSTGPFFTALVEPLVFRRKTDGRELALGAAVVMGVALLVNIETPATPAGLALGMGSAVLSATFGTLNGRFAKGQPPDRVTFYELTSAAVATTFFFLVWPEDFVTPQSLSALDAGLLLALAFFCTVLPWQWSLRVVQTLSPYTIAMVVALEPVYSMGLSFLLFPQTEVLGARFYVGAGVLVALVVLNTALKREASSPLST